MATDSFPYTPEFLDTVEGILFDNDPEEECLDLFGIHGLICSFKVSPAAPEREQWLNLVTGEENQLPETSTATLELAITQLDQHISEQLEEEEGFELPNEVFEDDNALINWCAGFVEGFLSSEKAWFDGQDEATVAGLLLPIMAHSDLFQDEDFEDIRQNDKLMAQMMTEIADNVIDLYLLYRS